MTGGFNSPRSISTPMRILILCALALIPFNSAAPAPAPEPVPGYLSSKDLFDVIAPSAFAFFLHKKGRETREKQQEEIDALKGELNSEKSARKDDLEDHVRR